MAAATTRPAMSRLGGLAILVVEDDATHRELLETLLKGEGARVKSAASVAEALTFAGRFRPDVILSDMQLPDGDGCALLQALRVRGIKAPAIAITGFEKETDRAFQAGFQLHISKPVRGEALLLVLSGFSSR